jgi:hypothetical protein
VKRTAIAVGTAAAVLSVLAYAAADRQGAASEAVHDYLAGYASTCTSNANPHAEGQRLHEHDQMLALVPLMEATSVAVKSGSWSDRANWVGGKVPGGGAKVLIAEGVNITVDADLGSDDLDWIRIDGELDFAVDVDTELRARTIVVPPTGTLDIGTPEHPVAASVTARITFVPRSAEGRAADRFDLAGGLIVHGHLGIAGTEKTAFAAPLTELKQGVAQLWFEQAPKGWAIGDSLLVAGASLGANEDEQLSVRSIDGTSVTLDRPLAHDHLLPSGFAGLPVANLTRNVVLASADPSVLAGRGHVMVMHSKGGTDIRYAAFEDLGRTAAAIPHTRPREQADGTLVGGSDANTIGRYPLHFHTVSGATSEMAPDIVRGSVFERSPSTGWSATAPM